MAQRSARGSLILFVGNSLATALNAVAIILMARLLGPALANQGLENHIRIEDAVLLLLKYM